jgi:homoserine dehydrogenase
MYYGRGAGASPTASAVVADIVSTAIGTMQPIFDTLGIWSDMTEKAVQLPIEEITGRYYLRLMVQDKPGVFAGIADTLGKQGISISSVLQKEPTGPPQTESGPTIVPVVITTHTANEGNIQEALRQFDHMDVVAGKSVCISIIDEHEETI